MFKWQKVGFRVFFPPLSLISVFRKDVTAPQLKQLHRLPENEGIWGDISHQADCEEHYKALALVVPPGCSCTPLGLLHPLEQRCFRQATGAGGCAVHPTYSSSSCALLSNRSEDFMTFFPRNALKSRNCLINTKRKEEKCPYKPSAYVLAEVVVGTPGMVFWFFHF